MEDLVGDLDEIPSQLTLAAKVGGGCSVEDGPFANNHRLTADANFLENACPARKRNVNSTRAAHSDSLKVDEPRGIVS
jgi:hypothetical protein